MMRIITGKARGIRLATLEGEATRPTTERVKEALFSAIQFDIEGRSVLDLFAGSGQLALEALSRGASYAVMTDKSKEAFKILKTNAEKTKLIDDCDIFNCDYKEYITKNKGRKFDIIFVDPPYAQKLYAPVLTALIDADMLKPTTLIICESGDGDVFGGNASLEARFEVVKNARYSHSYITMLRPMEA
jgi:16S rRNA (guanine(966)-N(2))-methyltransferase RsmD